MADWQDTIVGDRMTVDQAFAERVDESSFTRHEWGLIMTATSFEIANPEDDATAHLVAVTDALPEMMPELEKISSVGPAGAPADGGGSGDGLFGSLLGTLGLGGRSDDSADEERLEEAERLVAAYADELQAHLEDAGRWDEVRAVAASGADA